MSLLFPTAKNEKVILDGPSSKKKIPWKWRIFPQRVSKLPPWEAALDSLTKKVAKLLVGFDTRKVEKNWIGFSKAFYWISFLRKGPTWVYHKLMTNVKIKLDCLVSSGYLDHSPFSIRISD